MDHALSAHLIKPSIKNLSNVTVLKANLKLKLGNVSSALQNLFIEMEPVDVFLTTTKTTEVPAPNVTLE